MFEINCNRFFDAELATKLGDVNAAIIVNRLDYWIRQKRDRHYGVMIDGLVYIHNTFEQWVSEQFSWLTEWKFRQSMKILRSLNIVGVIRADAKNWNQTNYYTLHYDVLKKYLSKSECEAETIDTPEVRNDSSQGDEDLQLERINCELSYKEQKNTSERNTTEQLDTNVVVSPEKSPNNSDSFNKDSQVSKNGFESVPDDLNKDSRRSRKPTLEKILNSEWRSHLEEIKKLGIEVNDTIIKFIKTSDTQVVQNTIAIMESNLESVIPNRNGYFIDAIKGKWQPQKSSNKESFDYWFKMASELGYCTNHKTENNTIMVEISGIWQSWQEALAKFSINYLKKYYYSTT